MCIRDSSVDIVNGDATPSATDHTDFGSTTQGGGTVSRTFRVYNNGGSDLTITDLLVPLGFTVTDGLPLSILPGGEYDEFTVRLDDSVVGVKSGNISIANDDSDENPFTFAITGEVTAAPPGGSRFTSNVLVPVWGLVRSPVVGA